MTVQQLSDSLDVPEKRLRDWLREDFRDRAPGKGGHWELTPEMVERIKERAAAYRRAA